MSAHDEFALLDGAYVLGALEQDERHAYEQHLDGCAACRARVAGVTALPGLLAGVRLDDVLTLGAAVADPLPDTLLPRLLREAGAARRRARAVTFGLGAVAAACLAALVAVLITTGGSGGATRPSAERELTPLVSTPVAAYARLTPHGGGTRIDLTCEYRAAHGGPLSYAMTVVDVDGRRRTLSHWDIRPGQQVSYTADTTLPGGRISKLELTLPGGVPILRLRV